ncbi:Uncharacterised protein [Mycobacteroides abscessus subsp. abscessus]|nr:Uncharacterised protein [Mycobacteroides abscessus subsp. abscessus]
MSSKSNGHFSFKAWKVPEECLLGFLVQTGQWLIQEENIRLQQKGLDNPSLLHRSLRTILQGSFQKPFCIE